MNFKRLLSYIVPITIYQTQSDINKNLEIAWNNGRLVLDSKNTNFSFGSLEKVLQIGLFQIGKENIKTFQSVLLLGVGGGSAIGLLQNEFDFTGKITGIELDKKVIELAQNYFGLNTITNLELQNQDAEKFVAATKEKYDLIIIDIFQDNVMPDFLFSENFISNLTQILSKNGRVLFNSIVTLSQDFERNLSYQKLVSTHFSHVSKISKVEGDNELFILQK